MAKLNMQDLSSIDSKDLFQLANSAETGERYEDMCKFMNEIIKKACKDGSDGCTTDQRNMLSVAFKNVVGAKRQSMRALQSNIESIKADKGKDTESSDDQAAEIAIAEKYLKMVEKEVIDVCNQVLGVVLNGPLKKNDKKDEAKVFWLKMCGDYCRYLSEINNNPDAKVTVASPDGNKSTKPEERAKAFYQEAMEAAKSSLPETHPTRLGLALNYSVCYYEILDQKDEACKLAKQAFDDAIEKLDTLNDKSYKDSTLIMQLLRDNLTLWTQQESGGDQEQ